MIDRDRHWTPQEHNIIIESPASSYLKMTQHLKMTTDVRDTQIKSDEKCGFGRNQTKRPLPED